MQVSSPESLAGLRGAREDTIDLLAPFLGRDRASKAVSDLETVVAEEAEERVRPLLVGAIAIGALGVIAGGVAIVLSARR